MPLLADADGDDSEAEIERKRDLFNRTKALAPHARLRVPTDVHLDSKMKHYSAQVCPVAWRCARHISIPRIIFAAFGCVER